MAQVLKKPAAAEKASCSSSSKKGDTCCLENVTNSRIVAGGT
jgi:hypothetical protein